MPKYRSALPQLSDKLFLTDSGLETTLIFQDGIELPHFASIELMRSPKGRSRLRQYFRRHLAIARDRGTGFIFESPTWRASRDWAEKLGLKPAELAALNRRSIELMAEVRREYRGIVSPMVLSGCLGPRGDGYRPGEMMSADEAKDYHAEQIGAFRDTEADMIGAFTMNYIEEALGIARAASAAGMPAAISFTLETDGRLPTGETLKEAIETVDSQTDGSPAYYMINCAHPTHFEAIFASGEKWASRIRGLRANASMRSHAELDQATDLDDGDPAALGTQYRALLQKLPQLTILGGCCGTDHRHIEAISQACAMDHPQAAHAA
jgi:S-methylmethionine-dependent homocysteine/selenocysteine methylase